MDNREKWVIAQVAYYHRVNPSTARRWITLGYLEAEMVAGRWVVHPDKVRGFKRPQAGHERVISLTQYEKIAARRLEGESLQSIANDYDVTRERIRQIVNEVDPHIPERVKKAKKQVRKKANLEKLDEELRERMAYALENDLKCVVCGCWVIRRTSASHGENFTCSPEHSEAWTVLRTFDEHEKHRREMANTYLASPEKYEESSIEWAHQVLSDNPPPPNRRFFVPGSRRAKLVAKYRPERYREIVDGEV